MVKLLRWAGQDAELLADTNPVALVVLAHLKAQQTRQDVRERQRWRINTVREIFRRQLPDDEPRQLIGSIEALLDLPENLAQETMQTINNERRVPMPLETSFERYARQVGQKEGEQVGLRAGILAIVQVRLGKPDATFIDLVQQAELPALSQTLEAAKTAENLDELRAILRSADTAQA